MFMRVNAKCADQVRLGYSSLNAIDRQAPACEGGSTLSRVV